MRTFFIIVVLLFTASVFATEQDPYTIFVNDLREKFFKERTASRDLESIRYLDIPSYSRLFLVYNSIEFYNFHDRLNILKHNDLTKLFKDLSEKDPLSLNNYYAEIIDKYINQENLEPNNQATIKLIMFTGHFTPQLIKNLSRHPNSYSLSHLKKYKEDFFESNELTTLLQIIKYFGSFHVPFEEYLSEYSFFLNNKYRVIENFHNSTRDLYDIPTPYGSLGFFNMRYIILNEPNKRKHFYSDTYNLITPELELIYTPIIAASILGNITTEKGRNFLHYVTTIKDSNILEQLLLIPNISDFLEKTDNDGKNVTLYAAENGSYKNMKVLIEQGNYLQHQDNEGNNILHLAIKNKDYRVILVILQNTPEDILKELLVQKNNVGYEPINSFLSNIEERHLKKFMFYKSQGQSISIPGSANKAQHLLYYIPLLSKQLELGINNEPIIFDDLNNY